MLGELGGLFLRTDCVCCGRVVSTPSSRAIGSHICPSCVGELSAPWQRWDPPSAVLPVYAAGPYGGARRALIISAKDRLRPAAIKMMGRVYLAGLHGLASRGVVPDPRLGQVALLPAPTRRSAAKRRGGDIVTRAAQHARDVHQARHPEKGNNIGVFSVGQLAESTRDSVGLSRQERLSNVASGIVLDKEKLKVARRFVDNGGHAVIVDDVCTTGATSSQFALALAAEGISAAAIMVIAAA